jgi:hypothetical protein
MAGRRFNPHRKTFWQRKKWSLVTAILPYPSPFYSHRSHCCVRASQSHSLSDTIAFHQICAVLLCTLFAVLLKVRLHTLTHASTHTYTSTSTHSRILFADGLGSQRGNRLTNFSLPSYPMTSPPPPPQPTPFFLRPSSPCPPLLPKRSRRACPGAHFKAAEKPGVRGSTQAEGRGIGVAKYTRGAPRKGRGAAHSKGMVLFAFDFYAISTRCGLVCAA